MHFFVLHALQAYISIGTQRINGKRSRDQMIKCDIESKIFEILGKYLLASKMSLSLIAIFNSLVFFPKEKEKEKKKWNAKAIIRVWELN